MRLKAGLLMILIGLFNVTGFGNTTTDQIQNSSAVITSECDVGEPTAIVVTVQITHEIHGDDLAVKKHLEKGQTPSVLTLYQKQVNPVFYTKVPNYQQPHIEEIVKNLYKPPIESRIRNDT